MQHFKNYFTSTTIEKEGSELDVLVVGNIVTSVSQGSVSTFVTFQALFFLPIDSSRAANLSDCTPANLEWCAAVEP